MNWTWRVAAIKAIRLEATQRKGDPMSKKPDPVATPPKKKPDLRKQKYRKQQREIVPHVPPKVTNIIAKIAAIKTLIRAAKKALGAETRHGVEWDNLSKAVQNWEKLMKALRKKF
jgi:hypothetical protein